MIISIEMASCHHVTHVLETLTSSTRRSNGCRVGVAVEVVEDVCGSSGQPMGFGPRIDMAIAYHFGWFEF